MWLLFFFFSISFGLEIKPVRSPPTVVIPPASPMVATLVSSPQTPNTPSSQKVVFTDQFSTRSAFRDRVRVIRELLHPGVLNSAEIERTIQKLEAEYSSLFKHQPKKKDHVLVRECEKLHRSIDEIHLQLCSDPKCTDCAHPFYKKPSHMITYPPKSPDAITLDAYRSRVSELESQLDAGQSKNKLIEQASDIHALKQKLKASEERKQELLLQLQGSDDNQVEFLKQKLAEAERQNQLLAQQNAEAADQINILQSNIKELQDESYGNKIRNNENIEMLQQEHEIEVSRMQDEITRLQQQTAESQNELSRLQQQHAESQDELSLLDSTFEVAQSNFNDKYQEFNDQLFLYHNKLADYEAQIESLKAELADQTRIREEIDNHNCELHRLCDRLNQRNTEYDEENEELAERLQLAEDEIDRLKEEVGQKNSIDQSEDGMQAIVKSYDDQMQILQMDIKALTALIVQLQEELANRDASEAREQNPPAVHGQSVAGDIVSAEPDRYPNLDIYSPCSSPTHSFNESSCLERAPSPTTVIA